ncbi:MAG TPA: cation-translocating P-type ATPase [Bacillota bacterium]|nr:cation-translocating P-type ATPase [Bacillota bacterium]
MEKHWWRLDSKIVISNLGSDLHKGLPNEEAVQRIKRYGNNSIEQRKKLSPWSIFFAQFTDFMVLVLIGATVISALLGELIDAGTILAIILINAILGLVQEYRAERSLAALKELSAPQARVLRDSQIVLVDGKEVVPGDILMLEAGDRISADARIIIAEALEVNEAALTGESMSVVKDPKAIQEKELSLGDRKCMVYAGTTVTQGRGTAIVVATGMSTQLGEIAHLLENTEDEETPLQKRLDQLGHWLVFICLFICAAVATLGILRGEPFRVMFLTGVSLAVAAIPEGLPAIVTISLAIGVQRMIRRNVLIRKLPAVETLGCATVIGSDKTGTITQNRMVVTRFNVLDKEMKVLGEGYNPQGSISQDGHPWHVKLLKDRDEYIDHFFRALVFCNNARLIRTGQEWNIQGDPTEGALLTLAAKSGYSLDDQSVQRLGEIPFSSERRRMSVAVNYKGQHYLYVKGSVDNLLSLSVKIATSEGVQTISPFFKRQIEESAEKMAEAALRVLGVAYRPLYNLKEKLNKEEERDFIFLGLVGMMDPPRPEVKEAISRCRQAGIRTLMITGDHPATAKAVAEEIGLLQKGRIITGNELEMMDNAALTKVVGQADVYARVSPNHKLLLVRALKRRGEIVAMTGDGVNDAPAVKEASIGVAMGMTGTDVTKEASSMVITDDNFASIVAAVEEGRGIYENIRKFIRYLLGCNIGEVLTMFGASLLGLPLPLTPLQILWTNLVTDGLPAVALSMDPPDSGLMRLPPRSPREGIFGRGLGKRVLLQGIVIGGITLGIFALTLSLSHDLLMARTAAFASLVFSQLTYVFVCRSERRTLWQISLSKNPYLVGAVLVSGSMQLVAMNIPFFRNVFATVPLTGGQWLWILSGALISVVAAEAANGSRKIIMRRKRTGTI